MIVIVDYGMGNVGSVRNMLSRIGVDSVIASAPEALRSAQRLILPGVGAFDNAMTNLERMNMIPVLNDLVLARRVPVLGICLGMQLLSKRSEEGILPGLGWIDAETVKFNFDGENKPLKIPHMGWDTIKVARKGSFLDRLPEDSRFYFVHSYHVRCNMEENVLARTTYGIDFHSVIKKDNIVGTQFHPEKSHRFGIELLKAFMEAEI